MQLPVEIWHLVADSLGWDVKSILSLCLCSHRFHSALLEHLYRHVHLPKVSTISSFCFAMTPKLDQLAHHVQSLRIIAHLHPCYHPGCLGCYPLYMDKPLTLQLQPILERLFNLSELYFNVEQLDLFAKYLQIPFKLRHFTIGDLTPSQLDTLLSKQSSVTDLRLLPTNPKNRNRTVEWIGNNPQVLPNICAATGPLAALEDLSLWRQLTHVTIYHDYRQTNFFSWSPRLLRIANRCKDVSFAFTSFNFDLPKKDNRTLTVSEEWGCHVRNIPILTSDMNIQEMLSKIMELRLDDEKLRPVTSYDTFDNNLDSILLITLHKNNPHYKKVDPVEGRYSYAVAWMLCEPWEASQGLIVEGVIEELRKEVRKKP